MVSREGSAYYIFAKVKIVFIMKYALLFFLSLMTISCQVEKPLMIDPLG